MNSVNKAGAQNLIIISIQDIKGQPNRLPTAGVGGGRRTVVREGKSEFRMEVRPSVKLDNCGITRERRVCSFILKMRQESK